MVDEKKTPDPPRRKGFFGEFSDEMQQTIGLLSLGGIFVWLFAHGESRRLLRRLMRQGHLRLKQLGVESFEIRHDIVHWGAYEAVQFVMALKLTLATIIALGATALLVAASFEALLPKVLWSLTVVAVTTLISNIFWARSAPLAAAVLLAVGLIDRPTADALARGGKVPDGVLPRLSGTIHSTVDWMFTSWRYLNRAPFYMALGAVYATAVPFNQAPELLWFGALTIPVFFFGNVAWTSLEQRTAPFRGWALWFSGFILLDIAFLTYFPEFYRILLLNTAGGWQNLVARVVWGSVIFIEALLAYPPVRFYWFKRGVAKASGYNPVLGAAGMYGRGYGRRFNWTPIIIALIVAAVFIIGRSLGWHEKVTPSVASKVNPTINRITGRQLLPEGPQVDDAYVTATRPPLRVQNLADGWVAVTYTVEKGWVDSGLQIRPGQRLEYNTNPAPYRASASNHRFAIQGDGNIVNYGQLIPSNAVYSAAGPEWMRKLTLAHMIAPRQPYGAVLIRYGRVRWPLVADRLRGQHTPNMLLRPEKILLALNILQVENQFLTHTGTVTVRLRVV